MGDRWHLTLNCAECGASNYAYYAPSSGIDGFKCDACGEANEITLEFGARRKNKKSARE